MLRNRALLVSLKARSYSGIKTDKNASAEITSIHGVHPAVAKVVKKLFPLRPNKTPLSEVLNEARNYHHKQTLPWLAEGARILPSKNWQDYCSTIRGFKDRFNLAVAEEVKNYESNIETAKLDLRDLFHASDYPNTEEYEKMFELKAIVLPFPNIEDFRLTLEKEEVDKLTIELTGSIKSHLQSVVAEKMYGVLNHLSEKLALPDSTFRNSIISNIFDSIELCETLVGDPLLLKLISDTKAALTSGSYAIGATELREDKSLRTAVQHEAEILSKRYEALKL